MSSTLDSLKLLGLFKKAQSPVSDVSQSPSSTTTPLINISPSYAATPTSIHDKRTESFSEEEFSFSPEHVHARTPDLMSADLDIDDILIKAPTTPKPSTNRGSLKRVFNPKEVDEIHHKLYEKGCKLLIEKQQKSEN